MTKSITCASCGQQRDSSAGVACSNCGETARIIEVSISEKIETLEVTSIKVRRANQKGRPAYEAKSGQEINHARNEVVHVEQVVDREAHPAWYKKRVINKSGEVIRDVSEPLSQHTGRGDARPDKKSVTD